MQSTEKLYCTIVLSFPRSGRSCSPSAPPPHKTKQGDYMRSIERFVNKMARYGTFAIAIIYFP